MKPYLAALSAFLVAAAPAWPQDPPKKADPAPVQPAPEEENLEGVIADVKGVVDVKRPTDKDWVEAQRNMKLPKGSEVCTGAASSCTIVIGKGLILELKPVTMASLVALVKKHRLSQVDASLKFGSADIKLEKSEIRTDMQVATPAVTTSISGSHGIARAWAAGGERLISLRIFEGKWGRFVRSLGVEQEGNPGDALNDLGDFQFEMEALLLALQKKMNDGAGLDLPYGSEFSLPKGNWFEFGLPDYSPKAQGLGGPASQFLPPPPQPPTVP